MSKRRIKVVKVGGAVVANPEQLAEFNQLIGSLKSDGHDVLVVHGGGKEIGELHERLGISFRQELGLRVTSNEGMSVVTMILCGLVNKRLVAGLNASGVEAVGLSGADYGMMHAKLLNESRLGRVGGPPTVDHRPLAQHLSDGTVVVLAPVSIGPDGDLVNVNADVAAQSVAVALGADSLDFVTDVPVVKTRDGAAKTLTQRQVEHLMADNVVTGGMIPKLQASIAALGGGVNHVRVGNLDSLMSGVATEVRA